MTTSAIAKLKFDQLQARKDKNSFVANLLTTLIGEAEMIGKNDGNRAPTDDEVKTVVKKFVSNIDFSIGKLNEAKTENPVAMETFAKEKAVLLAYLPAQLDADQLRATIQKIIADKMLAGPKAMGAVMQELTANFKGAYDGKLASAITKELLA